MKGMHSAFRGPEEFQTEHSYSLMPIRFTALDKNRYMISNVVGDWVVASSDDLRALVRHELPVNSERYETFKSRHILADDESSVHLELMAAKYRTRQSRLPEFTSLHLFVVTLRCDHSCQYCQVSRVSQDRSAFDMTEETASKAIDLVLRGPSKYPKIEFQGGEPLLNFPLIKFVVESLKSRAPERRFNFVITTNLVPVTDEILHFCSSHRVAISTSLDGPAALHNKNRPRPGQNSHEIALEGIARARAYLGYDAVSALMTCTADSLQQPEKIIDEYARQGFSAIFLRYLSPYGFAAKTVGKMGYETDEFISFYKRGLAHIIRLNREGVKMTELYTRLILQRMLRPFPTGYVDLQSPSGIGTAVLAYNYNGDVYASDEGRMLAEMGDYTFRLGNVHRQSYEELFLDSSVLRIVHETMNEGRPGCCDCAFLPYCGSDPVFHHRTQGDSLGHQPTSAFCHRNMEVMRHIVKLLEDDSAAARILKGWI